MGRSRWRASRCSPAPTAPEGLERADARLLERLDIEFGRAARLAGAHLVCGPGCAECCHGPFPITPLDVRRLARGLDRLAREEPLRAAAVRARALRSVAALREGYPGNPETGRLEAGESGLDRFFERHQDLPCPALDPVTARCDVYAARPVSCRTYGPPARFGDEVTPPCRLCFRDASPDEIDRCRIEPDREGLEERILAGMGVPAGEDWETLIAFALAGGRPR